MALLALQVSPSLSMGLPHSLQRSGCCRCWHPAHAAQSLPRAAGAWGTLLDTEQLPLLCPCAPDSWCKRRWGCSPSAGGSSLAVTPCTFLQREPCTAPHQLLPDPSQPGIGAPPSHLAPHLAAHISAQHQFPQQRAPCSHPTSPEPRRWLSGHGGGWEWLCHRDC